MRTSNRFIPRLVELEDRRTPATFLVTTTADSADAGDGKLSLREAITAANATEAADKIKLRAGVYQMTIPGVSDDLNRTGDLDITDSVTIVGLGTDKTIVDAGQIDRAFHVQGTGPGSIVAAFNKMTIRNGHASTSAALGTPHGEGILATNADVSLTSSLVTRNIADSLGGGISNGGAIGTGTLTLTKSIVSRNRAVTGGGIFFRESTANLLASTVRRNVAEDRAGGLEARFANLTDCDVSDNIAAGEAGGI